MLDTPPEKPSEPNETRLLESLKLVKEWGTWLVTIQTAAIAAVGALIANPKPPLTLSERIFACSAVVMFTFSIICASYLLVSLPGFYARNAGSLDAKNFGNEAAFIKLWSRNSREISQQFRRPWLPQTGISSAILAAAEKIGGGISPRIHLNNLIAAEHATFVLGVLFFALFIAFKAI